MDHRIDPELLAVLPYLPTVDIAEPAAFRAAQRARTQPPQRPDGLLVEDRVVAGGVPVRIYTPTAAVEAAGAGGALGVLVWFHGGGFVFGDMDSTDGSCVATALEVGCVVVNVEYRLAPENPFPAGFDDAWAALRWVAEHASSIGADAGRIAVGGVSAGGGLAAALALRARDEGGPALVYQVLDTAVLDDRLDTPSMREFDATPLWSRPQAELSWRYYLAGAEANAYAAPARAEDVANLAPAYITANEFDPLRDEAIEYAVRLIRAGVPVELHHRPGTFHGSNAIPSAEVSRRALEDIRRALRAAFRVG
ncbi:alpha/beta hydrolase [Embleya hyalina]|uniref:Esterase n=1 Tax=Embleya hyalina TaxID=516124 RepID=A0A401YIP9_9ACTN|nr:alpha/beta hydrolase [Embleya hyalina]GCD94471.1 esterase [Embleya hyalina]